MILKHINAKAIFAKTEKNTFSQTVLIRHIFINAPISNNNVPIKIVMGKDFFLSEMLLKNIIEISISKKKIETNAKFTIKTNAS